MRFFTRHLAVLLLAAWAGAVTAADPTSSWGGTSGDKLAPVRAKVSAKDWNGAISELRQIDDKGNADWNNLMGYSLRKADAASNAADAERYYNEALRINPKHKGALEYSGELYLMTGNLTMAEKRLAELDKACFLPCEEHSDLKKAVARYKANGNRYVPQ